jgi:hypothetical protein
MESLLKRRIGVRAVGAPARYSSELIADVQTEVRREMAKLRAEGARRAGPKTAIARIVKRMIVDKKGQSGLADSEQLIAEKVTYFFKVWEAGRKRV